MKKFLLALTLIFFGVITFSTIVVSAEQEGIYTYVISNGEVAITTCDSAASGDIQIPLTIDGYYVTEIGNYAFQNCINLTSIKIPNNIEYIGDYAFYNCTSLREIHISTFIEYIGDNAFYGCNYLKNICFIGTEDDWEQLEFGSGNDALIDAEKNFIKGIKTDILDNGKEIGVTTVNIEVGKTAIVALYDSNQLVEMQKKILESDSTFFTTKEKYSIAKVMIWEDMTSIQPVCDASVIGPLYITRDTEIAFVLEVSDIEEDKWGDVELAIKLLTPQGVIEYGIASEINIDSSESLELNNDSDEIYHMLCELIGTVVKFELTSGEVAGIYTSSEEDAIEYVGYYEEEWSAEDNSFGNKNIDENAIVFSIDTEDIDNSYATTVAELNDGNTYIAELYVTADTDTDADIVIVNDLQLDIASKAEFAIITGIEETKNEDEEVIYELTVMHNGEKNIYKATAKIYEETAIEIGDVVKFKINADDVITNLVYVELPNVVRYNEGYADIFTAGAIVEGEEYMLAGYAYYRKSFKIYLEYGGETLEIFKPDRARRIYLVETTGRNKDRIKVTEGSIMDILWDKDLTVTIEDDTSEFCGYSVADISVPLTNDVGDEFTAAAAFTQIIATFTDEGDVDMIILIAGEDDYELVE